MTPLMRPARNFSRDRPGVAQFIFSKCSIFSIILSYFLLPGNAVAQSDSLTRSSDTATLASVTVTAFGIPAKWKDAPAAIAVLDKKQLQGFDNKSLIPVMNTVAGVRMEERSPGSYRLSIRGSLLRSPFGVRDVKIYFDEMPLTDAGGNTYLNAIDVNSVQGLEILKGPDGSLFGANSGGVVLIHPVNRYNDSSYLSAGVSGGSYGLVHQNAALQTHSGNNQF